MVLTVEECNRHIMHTLGSDELPAVGAMRILNNAGQYLASCHEWSWLIGGRVSLHFEEDQEYVWLPADLQSLVAYDVTQGLTSGFEMTTFNHLIELRTSSITSSTWINYGAITWQSPEAKATGTVTFTGLPADEDTLTVGDGVHDSVVFEFNDGSTPGITTATRSEIDITGFTTAAQVADTVQEKINGLRYSSSFPLDVDAVVDTTDTATVNLTARYAGTAANVTVARSSLLISTPTGMSGGRDGGEMLPRIDLWPTPAAALENAMTVYYRRGWLLLNEDDDSVNIPQYMEAVYIALVRAYTRGYEREDILPLEARIAQVLAGPDMQAAIGRDNLVQPDFGEMQGGAMQAISGAGTQIWNFNSTGGPS